MKEQTTKDVFAVVGILAFLALILFGLVWGVEATRNEIEDNYNNCEIKAEDYERLEETSKKNPELKINIQQAMEDGKVTNEEWNNLYLKLKDIKMDKAKQNLDNQITK